MCRCGAIPEYEVDGTDERLCAVCVLRIALDSDAFFDEEMAKLMAKLEPWHD